MTSEFEIEKRCIYGKAVGIVQLSPTHLLWTPDSAGVRDMLSTVSFTIIAREPNKCVAKDGNELQVALTSIRQYQVSKAGSAKKVRAFQMRFVCALSAMLTNIFSQFRQRFSWSAQTETLPSG